MTPTKSAAKEIPRDNIIDTLEGLFSDEIDIIVLEGQEGIGKTTVLKQLQKRHPDRTFAVFLSAASRWAYDPNILREEFCEQMARTVAEPQRGSDDQAPARRFNRLMYAVGREARSRGEDYYFVLDGLEEIPIEDRGTRDELFRLLPLGMHGIRCIVTGVPADLPFSASARRSLRPFPMSTVTREEAEHYLSGLSLTPGDLKAVCTEARGVPGWLASVRRLLEGGLSPAKVLDEIHQQAPNLFRLEWESVGTDSLRRLSLALLARDNRPYSLARMAYILKADCNAIEATLRTLRFLVWDEADPAAPGSTTVRFVTESFRRAVDNALAELRADIDDRIIAALQNDPEGSEALSQLPTIFSSTDRLADLVNYLSPDRVIALYQRSPSLMQVRQRTVLGAEAARKLNKHGDVVRFSLQESTICEIAESSLESSEVRALTALRETDAALAIAERAVRESDRFKLLVAIAKTHREMGLPEDPTLRDRIVTKYNELDPASLGEQAADVAADLFHSFPDLAIELVSRSAGNTSGENALDWAFARLAVQAQRDDRDFGQQKAREIRDRIESPAARRLSTEAIMLMGNLAGPEAIREASRLDQAADQLYVLRHWMIANAKREDALLVLDHALQLALKATGYSPNAQVYRELATCLPFGRDEHEVHYHLAKFEAQRSSIERLGPTEEFIRLQLILARTRWRFDKSAGRERYTDIYYSIERIADLASRVSCLARLVASLRRVDPERELDVDQIHAIAEQELRDRLAELLKVTADHYEVAKPVIEALSASCFELAREVTTQLNTLWRRDYALELLIGSGTSSNESVAGASEIRLALAAITDDAGRERARESWIWNAMRRARSGAVVRLSVLIDDVLELKDAASCCRAAAECLARIGNEAPESDVERLQAAIVQRWHRLESDWTKVDIGYEMIAVVARAFPAFARRLADDINTEQSSLTLFDAETSSAASLGLRLASRAYGALVARDLATPTDLPRLRNAINRMGSLYEQACLWSDVALRLFSLGKSDNGKEIVVSELHPLLTASRAIEPSVRSALIVAIAPAIQLGAPGAFVPLLAELNSVARDNALREVCRFILRKCVPGDPYESVPRAGYDIDYTTAQGLIALAKEMSSDALVFETILNVVDSMTSPRFGGEFKRAQKSEVVHQLRELAKTKFPAPEGITHQGYVIAANATILRLCDLEDTRLAAPQLLGDAHNIPNLSDRAFVLGYVAQSIRDSKPRREAIAQAEGVIDRLPLLDRIDRLTALSEMLTIAEPVKSRELLQKALTITANGTGETIAERRRSIVDELYRRDPKNASSIASVLDDDPAKERVEKRLALHRLKDTLATPRGTGQKVPSSNPQEYSRAAWLQLGDLIAGRTPALPPSRTLEYMHLAAIQPVRQAYPIFAWAIENASRNNGAETRTFLVPLFEACLAGAELALRAATRPDVAPLPLRVRSERAGQQAITSILIRDGERQDGLSFMRKWLHATRPSELWIADPYFIPASLEALLLVQEAVPECRIRVLTGKLAHRRVASPYDDTYRDEWTRLSSAEIPKTSIVIAGTIVSSKCPVHDRWWLCTDGGLKLGTSLSGIGGRWSEISTIPADDARRLLNDLEPFFLTSVRQFEGESLRYNTLDL